jgi:hypothetical protein
MPGLDKVTKAEVLLRASRLLESRLPDFTNRIHIVIEDTVPQTLQNNQVLTIQLTGGQFRAGGGNNVSLPYEGVLRICIWSMSQLDQPGTGQAALTSSGRGLLRLQTKILKAFWGSYLHEAEAGGDGYTPILTDVLRPVSDAQAQMTKDKPAAATSCLDFAIDFVWDVDGDLDSEGEG